MTTGSERPPSSGQALYTMTGPLVTDDKTATDRCDCGHVRGHHNTYQGNVYYRAHTRCNFKGCGCPKFIAKPRETEGA